MVTIKRVRVLGILFVYRLRLFIYLLAYYCDYFCYRNNLQNTNKGSISSGSGLYTLVQRSYTSSEFIIENTMIRGYFRMDMVRVNFLEFDGVYVLSRVHIPYRGSIIRD